MQYRKVSLVLFSHSVYPLDSFDCIQQRGILANLRQERELLKGCEIDGRKTAYFRPWKEQGYQSQSRQIVFLGMSLFQLFLMRLSFGSRFPYVEQRVCLVEFGHAEVKASLFSLTKGEQKCYFQKRGNGSGPNNICHYQGFT